MSTGGLICIMMLTGYFWTIDMISAVIFETRLNLFDNKIYMKQSNKEEIGRNIIEPTANKREKLKSLRENLKLFLIKSMNGKIDKTGGISFLESFICLCGKNRKICCNLDYQYNFFHKIDVNEGSCCYFKKNNYGLTLSFIGGY